jgi:hypothetical protein
MKCVGASYLEAIRCLKDQDKQPCRTIHLSYVPGNYSFLVINIFKILLIYN